MTGQAARLRAVADLLAPCDPPDLTDPGDLTGTHPRTGQGPSCPDHPDQPWPCDLTRAAWLARGLHPATEADAARPAAEGDAW